MNIFKSVLLAAAVALAGVSAQASTLSASQRTTPLYSCGGQASLSFTGGSAYLLIEGTSQCHFVVNSMGQLEPINAGGYLLRKNAVYEVVVTSRSQKHQDRIMIDTHIFTPPPAPSPRRPKHMGFPTVSVRANDVPVALPSCGGTVTLHQTLILGRPLLSFRNVQNCTFYQVLAADANVYVDEAQARLSGAPGNYFLINQEVPSSWSGYQEVIVRLQSASGKHGTDIVVRFDR